ncbi:uncharacterized protein J8A68_002553 [[Candida] subhashii]|uniref:Uncharacterized protein n=1 Tax=[Candida] subhashii TaxID=561895 RepID=A0A8J5QNU6_9ASCO|nr:uncharacterized protein J8A68_002553 [[Candida] subhashii]KAG7663926.1 hypothetical protein J8A68_002553 [[Candida] subhashii]
MIKRRKRRSSTPVISINGSVSGTLSEENLQKLRNGFEFNQEKILKNSVIAEEEGEEEEILSEDISSTGT